MRRLVVIALIAAAGWFYFARPAPAPRVEAAPAQVALRALAQTQPPLQREPDRPTVFSVNGYELRTLRAFALKARVLAVEHYRSGRESDLSPMDIAFGWGRMADPAVVDRLSISQSGRWYTWRYSGTPPLPQREIETSSANMHLIPASRDVARALGEARKGRIVSLSGYLVEARAKDGWSWVSSLTRDDTGNGSCELVFVQAIELH